jgi:hypothetical protein
MEDEVRRVLLSEGWHESEIDLNGHIGVVTNGQDIAGVYVYRIEGDFPHLIHFWVSPEFRYGYFALALINQWRAAIQGYVAGLMHSPKVRPDLDRLVAWYARRHGGRYYAENAHAKYYFILI